MIRGSNRVGFQPRTEPAERRAFFDQLRQLTKLETQLEPGSAIPDAAGGANIDAEARAALNALLADLRARGLIAS